MPKSFIVVVAPVYSCLVFGFGVNNSDSTYSTVFHLGLISITVSHDKEPEDKRQG